MERLSQKTQEVITACYTSTILFVSFQPALCYIDRSVFKLQLRCGGKVRTSSKVIDQLLIRMKK